MENHPNLQSQDGIGYHAKNFLRAYKSWMLPYVKSRFHPGQFRPILSFLYTDLNCNLNCHYCFSRGKNIPGMDWQTAIDAVDWLHSTGCRVLAYMGGEPLVRKQFIIDLTRYAADKGFFVYLPTNGVLMDEAFINAIGQAGVSTINLAVDAWDGYKGIPKYFTRIRNQFEYLVQQQKIHGYIPFLNINITSKNIKDVKALTQLAEDYGIGTDYHINEQPPITYQNFKHEEDGAWITERDIQDVDELVDWLINKNRRGFPMVNSIEHLEGMKLFIRNELPSWPCQAGRMTFIIRLDGSFAPCFELYGDQEDWGNIYDGPKFDPVKLEGQKEECSPHCLSTCNFQTKHYSRSWRYSLQWLAKHAHAHFFGVS